MVSISETNATAFPNKDVNDIQHATMTVPSNRVYQWETSSQSIALVYLEEDVNDSPSVTTKSMLNGVFQ